MRTRILLHLCCGPCGTECVRRLAVEGEVVLFFSNCNIHPPEEFYRRLRAARELAMRSGRPLVVDDYDHDQWRVFIRGLERAPEKGARCRKCFEFSLRRAYAYAEEHGLDAITTSLTISPHKKAGDIFAVERRIGDRFLAIDFKKEDGFRKSLDTSREWGLYRQNYCGCEFSLKASGMRRTGGTARTDGQSDRTTIRTR